jgi:predicted DNA-binding antitoxin AbrB/MazE fold protein
MTAQPVRAVYERGRLRLLDPVDLTEGQEVHVTILSERDRAIAALKDILVEYPEEPDDALDDIDEEAIMREIEEAFRGQPPLSDSIIEERREGP